MKKGQIYEGKVDNVKFPNKGIVRTSRLVCENEDESCASPEEQSVSINSCPAVVKNTLPGQSIRFAVRRVRHGTAEGRLLAVTEKSPLEMDKAACPHYGICGGCSYQSLPYEEQLKLKSKQVLELLRDVIPGVEDLFEGIRPSPRQFGYRNKMEFTFGDEYKGGPLTVGMHRRGSMYDIVPVDQCRIADEDFRAILTATQEYFRETGIPYYHRMKHEGWLRHLLVRKAERTGEILVDLVTTTQSVSRVIESGQAEEESVAGGGEDKEEALLYGWCERIRTLSLDGHIVGILHTINDSLGDVVLNEGTEILCGQDYFYEELLGLKFRITPFSFFQTNSPGAEVLYGTGRELIGDALKQKETVYDLYSGTGTIAQMLAPACARVIGVEIVEEAVVAARENAAENGLANCEFIVGDVLTVLDKVEEKPDFIVLDPPRDGVHPKALRKIIGFGVRRMLYISCKPTSLQRDLTVLKENGYKVERICCVDMFPGTVHVETVCLLTLS